MLFVKPHVPEVITIPLSTSNGVCTVYRRRQSNWIPSWSLLSRITLSTICHSPGFQKTACVRAHLLSLTLVTPRTIACQASLSMGFLRQKYWSGLPFPSPGDCRNLRIEPVSPALAGGFFTTEPPGKSSRKQSLRHKFIRSQEWGVRFQGCKSEGAGEWGRETEEGCRHQEVQYWTSPSTVLRAAGGWSQVNLLACRTTWAITIDWWLSSNDGGG